MVCPSLWAATTKYTFQSPESDTEWFNTSIYLINHTGKVARIRINEDVRIREVRMCQNPRHLIDNLVDNLKGPLDYRESTRKSAGELYKLSLKALRYPSPWSLGAFPGRCVESVLCKHSLQ